MKMQGRNEEKRTEDEVNTSRAARKGLMTVTPTPVSALFTTTCSVRLQLLCFVKQKQEIGKRNVLFDFSFQSVDRNCNVLHICFLCEMNFEHFYIFRFFYMQSSSGGHIPKVGVHTKFYFCDIFSRFPSLKNRLVKFGTH